MRKEQTKNMLLSAMFLALGLILPLFFGRYPGLGRMLLPMHIPVFLCGLICGYKSGALVGFVVPLLSYMMFGNLPLYPQTVGMSFELATYGAITGVIYEGKKDTAWLYIAMISAMIAGRIVWGVMRAILLGVEGKLFTFEMFVATAIVEAIPGIVLQFALIPAIMSALQYVNKNKEKRHGKISVQK